MLIEEAFVLCRYEWMRTALTEFVKVMEMGKNKTEHEMMLETKEDQPMTQDEDRQLMSSNCHASGPVTMSTSYGIMLPASIFL